MLCHEVSMKQNLAGSFCYKYQGKKFQKGKKKEVERKKRQTPLLN